MKTVEELADEHWEFIDGLIDSLEHEGKTEEYLFKTAFLHGYKHAKQEVTS